MPDLRRLLIGGDPSPWSEAGFTLDGDRTVIGTIELRFVEGEPAGVVGWQLDRGAAGIDPDGGEIDGLPTTVTDDPPSEPVVHANRVSRLDHVVVTTPDLTRTTAALEAAGFEIRRTRDVPGSRPARRQAFLWAGEAIVEVGGPVEPAGDGPAAIWGLALTSDDLDAALDLLGPLASPDRPAVQPGRRIATIDTATLGIGPALALMSPHVPESRHRPTRG